MRKFIAIIVMLLSAIVANAQVTYSKPKEPTFEWIQDILHTFNTDTYDLCLDSNNEFEDHSVVIKLGKGKEQAIKSMCAIKQMFDDAGTNYTFYLGGHKFTKISYDKAATMVNGAAGMYVITEKDLKRWVRVLKQGEQPRPQIINIEDFTVDLDEEETIPFQLVEVKPTFNGGSTSEFSIWVMENIVYPKDFSEKVRVTVQFVINKDGNIVNPKILRGYNDEYDNEAIRVITMSPKWTPGQQMGKAINTVLTFPVIFE